MSDRDRADAPRPTVAAVILAAGESSRMPGPSKLLQDFREESVIRTVARTAARSGLAPIVVVSAGDDDLGAHLRDMPVHIRLTGRRGGDRLTSVVCGLRASEVAGADAVVLLLGDEPEIDETDIATVRDRWLDGGADLVRTRYPDRPGHPVILSADVAARLLADPPREGDPDRVWELLRERCEDWIEISVRRPSPIDVDTVAALERARARRRAP